MVAIGAVFCLALALPPGPDAIQGEKSGEANATPEELAVLGDDFQLGSKLGKIHMVVGSGDEIRLYLKEGGRYKEPKVIYPVQKPKKGAEGTGRPIQMVTFRYGPEGDLHVFFQLGDREEPRRELFYGRFSIDGKQRSPWLRFGGTGSTKEACQLLGTILKGKDFFYVYTLNWTETRRGSSLSTYSNTRTILGYLQGGNYKSARVFWDDPFSYRGGTVLGTSEKDALALVEGRGQLCWSVLDRYTPKTATSPFQDASIDGYSAFLSKEGTVYAVVALQTENMSLKRKLWLGSGKLGKAIEPLQGSGILDASFRLPLRWCTANPEGKVYLFAGIAMGEDAGAKTRLAWWDLSARPLPGPKFIPGVEVTDLRGLRGVLKDAKEGEIAWNDGGTIHSRPFSLQD